MGTSLLWHDTEHDPSFQKRGAITNSVNLITQVLASLGAERCRFHSAFFQRNEYGVVYGEGRNAELKVNLKLQPCFQPLAKMTFTRHVTVFCCRVLLSRHDRATRDSKIQLRGHRFERAMLALPLCSDVTLTSDFTSLNYDCKVPTAVPTRE